MTDGVANRTERVGGFTAEDSVAQPRKVSDAQREAIREYMHRYITSGTAAEEAIKYICAVFESTDEPTAK